MKYYCVAEMHITDPAWVESYVGNVTAMVERHGGRYLARTRKVEKLEGEREAPQIFLLIEWPSREAIDAFYDSDEYRPYRDSRQRGAKNDFFIIAGEDIARRTRTASGTFDVKLTPQPATDDLGRMSIDKQFHGDLEATSRGEMMMAGTPVNGSAGYVAIERVTGAIDGRAGSFVLQHYGLMNRGAGQLTIGVVPDSGSGALSGIRGSMEIDIRDGKHFYRFTYTLG